MTPPNDRAQTTAERRAAVLAARAKAVAAYELEADIVPGTCHVDGATPDTIGTPAGGQEWEGLARMAQARQAAGLPLTDNDRIALHAHPNPRSGLTGAPTRPPA